VRGPPVSHVPLLVATPQSHLDPSPLFLSLGLPLCVASRRTERSAPLALLSSHRRLHSQLRPRFPLARFRLVPSRSRLVPVSFPSVSSLVRPASVSDCPVCLRASRFSVPFPLRTSWLLASPLRVLLTQACNPLPSVHPLSVLSAPLAYHPLSACRSSPLRPEPVDPLCPPVVSGLHPYSAPALRVACIGETD